MRKYRYKHAIGLTEVCFGACFVLSASLILAIELLPFVEKVQRRGATLLVQGEVANIAELAAYSESLSSHAFTELGSGLYVEGAAGSFDVYLENETAPSMAFRYVLDDSDTAAARLKLYCTAVNTYFLASLCSDPK